MKFLKIILFGIIPILGVKAQTYSHVVPDSDIEQVILLEIGQADSNRQSRQTNTEIMNWNQVAIKHESGFAQLSKMLMEYDAGDALQEIGELFNNADLEYMEAQFDSQIGKQWKVSSENNEWVSKSAKKNSAYTIPLFDRHHKTAIVYKRVKYGKNRSNDFFQLYIRKDRFWEFYKSVSIKKQDRKI